LEQPRFGSEVARNTLWNLAGQVGPLVVGLAAIPLLIRQLGTDRFGVLTLVWVAIGYLSLFDLGIGRALTHVVAARRGRGTAAEAVPLVWTGLGFMVLVGLAGSAVLVVGGRWLVEVALNVPRALVRESLLACYLVALVLPAVIASAGLRAVLEGWERFGLANGVRFFVSSLTYLAPVAVSFWRPDLVAVVASLAAVRLAGALAYLILCLHVVPHFRGIPRPDFSKARELLKVGGWMAVSNVVSPILVNLDRFIIGSMLTMSAVAYYATPYEVVTKLLVPPAAISAVLFPAFSRTYAGQRGSVVRLFASAIEGSFFLLFPLVLGVILLAPELLRIWVGPEFAKNSSAVTRVLAVGVLINGVAHIPFVLVQGAGRPDLTGKLHLVELPLYVGLLWWLTAAYGLLGAAMAWTGRVTVDAVVLFAAALRLLGSTRDLLGQIGKLAVISVGFGAAALLVSGWFAKSAYLVFAVLGFLAVFWRYVLEDEARLVLRTLWARRCGRA